MMPKPWKTVSSRVVYENPWTKIREDIAEMPNGKQTIYGVMQNVDAVGILPFIDDDHVIMVRQYRYVFGENHRWEMPTGAVKENEDHEVAARRELREEIGYDADSLQFLNTFYSSKSIVQETVHVYVGHNLRQAQGTPDETEFLEVQTFPFKDVLQMVLDSEIRDSMTVVAVLHAARLRNE
ncbi:MAG: NUDIX hydrolase [Chloroflexota bacterium]